MLVLSQNDPISDHNALYGVKMREGRWVEKYEELIAIDLRAIPPWSKKGSFLDKSHAQPFFTGSACPLPSL